VPWAPRTERMGCVTSLTMPWRTCSDIIAAACDWCRILWVSGWTLPQVIEVDWIKFNTYMIKLGLAVHE
jgi:hypothetical protein